MLMTDAKTVPADGIEHGVVLGDSETIPWERDLLTLFAQNQIKVILALPLFAVLFASITLLWTPWHQTLTWFASALGCQLIQYCLCRFYLRAKPTKSKFQEWLGIMTASEFLTAACWAAPLFLLWDNATDLQHVFMVACLMVMIAARIMISANFMPIIVAGTGLMTFALALRCLGESGYLYAGLGALAIGCQIFFVLLARKLQETARDMLIFKAQKEELVSRLVVERDRAEAAKADAEREKQRAEEASKAKSQFLATMSHELRTPLNAILGFSEIISREMFGRHEVSAYKTYADDIHNSGSYLLSLVNDILDLTRIEAGRRDVRDEPLVIGDTLEDVRNFVAFRLKERAQTLVFDIPPMLPKVMADRRAVRQIWINLLSNAAKFSPNGSEITVRAAYRETGEIAVSFIDNGPGMPEEEIETAMQAFARGSLAVKKAVDGAGLGLPIVKGLITMHDGRFELRSKPGQGTEATVVFPLARVLSGPRAEIVADAAASASQRKLIAITS
ncbi:sensor histidine kinase [Taklimakanibacter lacteus]|uniref:sensor histidine kinase n=1 Tax=Taklimakanibacter lacteus TaxID=2268456 RepID=UPI000E661A5A